MFNESQKAIIWSRIRSKIKVSAQGCWNFTGRLNTYGYGQMIFLGKQHQVHRLTYVLTHGVSLVRSTYICHTCDNPKCCNPAHLWAGRSRDNLLDCVAKGRHQEANQTHCNRGHLLSGENLRRVGRRRRCKICDRGRQRLRWGWPDHLAFSSPRHARLTSQRT